MSCCSTEHCLFKKDIFLNVKIEPESKKYPKNASLTSPKKEGRKRRGVKKMRGWLLVFPGLQASNGGRLVGIQAGAVMYLHGLQHCSERTCSPVPVGV